VAFNEVSGEVKYFVSNATAAPLGRLLSGDVQGVNHLRNIIRVCLETPWVMHWLPTRDREGKGIGN
jgi:hypothetical protein